jgi:hypothetical protein
MRREWKAVAWFGGAFALIMLSAIVAIDPAFFYPRLQTDPLNYYLKAQSLTETGSTTARWAVNLPPFPYVSLPGLLRVPFIAAFREFDDQLRAIQIFNIPIVGSVAVMSAYILSWTQPVRRHWMTVAFAFGFTLLSPIWIANVFLPLADAPYSAFTLAVLLVAVRITCSARTSARQIWWIAIFALLLTTAFLLRFTAPVLLVYAGTLGLGKWRIADMSRRAKVTVIASTAVFLVALASFNLQAILGRYFFEPLYFLVKGDKPGMVLNLFGAAVPSQIIPDFQLGFRHPPIQAIFHTTFASSPQDVVWTAVGLAISAIVVAGAWVARTKYLPEILYVVAPLPVLALMLPSTTRYLTSYQAFMWIFFYYGVVALTARYKWLTRAARSRVAVVTAVVVLLSVVVGLRWGKLAGTASERNLAVTVTHAPRYVREVSATFRGLRGFLESLPRHNTLLIGWSGNVGRWKVISDRDYYYPDSALASAVRTKNVYLLAECGTLEACQSWDIWKEQRKNDVLRFGNFRFDTVYAAGSGLAKVEVFRMSEIQ